MLECTSRTHPDKFDRIMVYVLLIIAVVAMLVSHHYFGGGVWITRLLEYACVAMLAWAMWEFIRYRQFVTDRRTHDGYLPMGSKNLFWHSDRDPDEPGVM